MHHWLPPPMGEAGALLLGAEDGEETATLPDWLLDLLAGATGAADDEAAGYTDTAATGADDDGVAEDDRTAEDTGTAAAGADDVEAAWVVIAAELVKGQTKTSEVLVMVIVVSGCVYVPAE